MFLYRSGHPAYTDNENDGLTYFDRFKEVMIKLCFIHSLTALQNKVTDVHLVIASQ